MSQFNPRTRDADGVPTQVIHSKKRRVVCRACEPHVWFVLIVDAERASPTAVRDAVLQSALQWSYQTFRFLHGEIEQYLPSSATTLSLIHI